MDYQKIKVYIVFTFKQNGFHKARLVADGLLTTEPDETVYSGDVCLRSLRIVMLLPELNQLDLWEQTPVMHTLRPTPRRNCSSLLGLNLMTWNDTFSSWTRHCIEQEH